MYAPFPNRRRPAMRRAVVRKAPADPLQGEDKT
jgi:hypothetical protein